MKFIGHYGCTGDNEEIAILARSKAAAENFIFECACESFESFSHYDEYIDEEEYQEAMMQDIEYYVEPFDYNNEEHLFILKEQENNFWEI